MGEANIQSLFFTASRSITRIWLWLRYRLLTHRHRQLVIEHIDDTPFIILQNVFNPVIFRTGEILARSIQSTPLLNPRLDHPPLVLDLGCGSGIGAVFAARRGAQVIASDLNPDAVRCVKINSILNRFDAKIGARTGDLFEPVRGLRFDLILFNPPFYRGRPKDNFDMAWHGEEIFERFAEGLHQHLTPSGHAFIVLSTDGEGEVALAELRARGFTVISILQRDFVNEVITVYDVSSSRKISHHDHSL